jgi:hypothetical protein
MYQNNNNNNNNMEVKNRKSNGGVKNSNTFKNDITTTTTTTTTTNSSGSAAKSYLLCVPFPWVSMASLVMPLTAFVYCIVYSFFYHYEWTTQTHCNVWNFAPSISASIGLFRPQKYVWKMLVSLHSAPRLLLTLMYR